MKIKNKKIRIATERDCAPILQIYIPFVTDTTITFECNVPTLKEFQIRMATIQENLPWLVCEINDTIAGYAYASSFKEREAYDWSVDFSVYINPEYQGKKIGTAFYYSLIELLKLQGFYNVYAGVTTPNLKSENLHQSFGFKTIGVYQNVGYKFDAWHDVKCYSLAIKEHIQSPVNPKTINEIINTEEFNKIIQKAEQMIIG